MRYCAVCGQVEGSVFHSKRMQSGHTFNAGGMTGRPARNTDLVERIYGEKGVAVNEHAVWVIIQELDSVHPMKVEGRGWFDLAMRRFTHKQTHREIGEAYRVHPTRIRQLEAKLLRLLRHPSRTSRYERFAR